MTARFQRPGLALLLALSCCAGACADPDDGPPGPTWLARACQRYDACDLLKPPLSDFLGDTREACESRFDAPSMPGRGSATGSTDAAVCVVDGPACLQALARAPCGELATGVPAACACAGPSVDADSGVTTPK